MCNFVSNEVATDYNAGFQQKFKIHLRGAYKPNPACQLVGGQASAAILENHISCRYGR